MASGGNLGAPEILQIWEMDVGYATPKVDVRSVVLDDQGRILLVQEKSDGLWTLPGGWADPNDSPKDVAAREVREEASLYVQPLRLLALLDRSVQNHKPVFPYHVYKLFILCEWQGGEPAPGSETQDAGWFDLGNLPPLSEGRVLPKQITRMVELAADATIPPDLD
jgi:ADP-ribose pyrophosphatase YjhB (NUDIX family)